MPRRLDQVHRVPDRVLASTHVVHLRKNRPRESARFGPLVPGLPFSLADLKFEALLVVGWANAGAEQILAIELNGRFAFGTKLHESTAHLPDVEPVRDLVHQGEADTRGSSANHDAPDNDSCAGPVQDRAPTPAPELVAVAPRSELGALGLADAHQRQSLRMAGETDVVGGDADAGVPEEALAVLDRFPALLQRREVPAFALHAHDPEAAADRVEGQPAPHWERLHHLIGTQRLVAEHARFVHGGPCWPGA